MLLSCTRALRGRWGTRDFLRGRSKRGGAIHIRHTHGSKGRFKRLSVHYGIRDGRRHAGNRLKGGLGVKLGGGLFGLRIPRQHALSTMTREAFELEMYGHPNITNPFRDLLEEHPALREVMTNAAPRVDLVVLMPRTPRLTAEADTAPPLPPAWRALAAALTRLQERPDGAAASASAPEPQEDAPPSSPPWLSSVQLCTVDSAVRCACGPSTPPHGAFARDVEASLHALYAHYRRGRKLSLPARTSDVAAADRKRRVPEPASPAQQQRRRPLLGAALRAGPVRGPLSTGQPLSTRAAEECGAMPSHARTGSSYTSAALSLARSLESNGGHAPGAPTGVGAPLARLSRSRPAAGRDRREEAPSTDTADDGEESSRGVVACSGRHAVTKDGRDSAPPEAPEPRRTYADVGGVEEVWRALRRQHPGALCLCMRAGTSALRTPGPTPAPGSSTQHRHQPPVPLLKEDVDVDEEVGVWGPSHPRSRTSALLRWSYANDDPRAHCTDAIPHRQRRLPVVLLVDASRLGLPMGRLPSPLPAEADSGDEPRARRAAAAAAAAATEGGLDALVQTHTRSLLSRRMSVELAECGFRAVAEDSLWEVAHALSQWSTEQQWRAFQSTLAHLSVDVHRRGASSPTSSALEGTPEHRDDRVVVG